MRKLLVSIAVAGFILSGCCGHCPKQDLVDLVFTPYGPIVVQTDKDRYSDEEYHSLERFLVMDGWITVEEYKAYIEEWRKEQKKFEEQEGTI